MSIREVVEYALELGGGLPEQAERARGSLTSLAGAAQLGLQASGALAAGALAAGTSFAALADEVHGVVDELGDLAAASGLEIETLQGLRLAASATGGELAALVPKDLPDLMAKAAGGSEKAAAGFRTLGVEVVDSTGHLRSADDVLWETLDALYAIEDPTTRAALAAKTLGGAGKELLGTFEDTAGLERFVAGAREFGIQAGPEAAEAAARWQSATANLKLALEDVSATLVENFSDGASDWVNNIALGTVYLTALFEGLAEVAGVAGDEVIGNINRIADHIKGEQDKADNGKVTLGAFGKAAIEHAPQEVDGNQIKTAAEIGDTIASALEEAMAKALERAKAFHDAFQREPLAPPPDAGGGGGAPVPTFGAPEKPFLDPYALGSEIFREGQVALDASLDALLAGLDGSSVETLALIDELQAATAATRALEQVQLAEQARQAAIEQTAAELTTVAGSLQGGMEGIIGTAVSQLGMAADPITAVVVSLLGVVNDLPELLLSTVLDVADFVGELPDTVTQLLTQLPQALLSVLPELLVGIATMGPEVIEAIIESLPLLISALIQAGPAMGIAMGEAIVGALETFFSPDFWLGVGEAIAEAIGDAFQNVGKDVGKALFESGPLDFLVSTADERKGKGRGASVGVPYVDPEQDTGPRGPGWSGGPKGGGDGGAASSRSSGRGRSFGDVTIVAPNAREVARQMREMQGTYGLNESIDPWV